MTAEVSPLWRMLRECPDAFVNMSPARLARLRLDFDIANRDDQIIAPSKIRQSFGLLTGRGFGKTYSICSKLLADVYAGRITSIGLMGPTDERTRQEMVERLIEYAPWYDRPRYTNNELVWSNGAKAKCFTAENPKGPRGSNLDCSWGSELVAWPGNTRREAWETLSTATRNRDFDRLYWDTTSLGKNDLIIDRINANEADPVRHELRRGSIFDNPTFGIEYLRDQLLLYPTGRRRDEELFGMAFTEAAGALWEAEWIARARVPSAPAAYDLRLVAIDPATTHGKEADLFGMCVGQALGGEIYVVKDLSDKYDGDRWANRALDEWEAGASGIICEMTGNSGGHFLVTIIRSCANARGITIVEWPKDRGPIPPKRPGQRVCYWRETKARDAKETRAYAPAGLTERGHVHMVGNHDALEHEMTTWVPGDRKSPNRLDALVYLVLELSGLERQTRPDGAKTAAATAKAADKLRGLLSRAGTRRV